MRRIFWSTNHEERDHRIVARKMNSGSVKQRENFSIGIIRRKMDLKKTNGAILRNRKVEWDRSSHISYL
jgi:hypothetical protein